MTMESVPSSSSGKCPQCGSPLDTEAPEGLCAACLLAGVAMPTEVGTTGHSTSAAAEPLPDLETIAAAFPNLQIDSLIGRGGMGAVYKARQAHLERWIALKVLPSRLSADPAFAERFSREARVLANLNHPNIVTLYDFGQSGDYFYLLMEYVDGVNLRQAMRAGQFTPEQALEIVPKICEALQYAHGEGILHRDIKPDNILLDTRGRLKIADFGIAKVIGKSELDSSLEGSAPPKQPSPPNLTKASTALGTPHYMAPEQATQPNSVDHRADIYSLGVVFYEMLTGELPVGNFAPPSEKSSVDSRIDEVVLRALKTEREQRQQSAREVLTQVETIAHDGITNTPPTTTSSKSRFTPVLATVLIVLGLLIPFFLYLNLTIEGEARAADRALMEARREAAESKQLALEQIDRQIADSPDQATRDLLGEERLQLERDLAEDRRGSANRYSESRLSSVGVGLRLLTLALGPALLLLGTYRGWRHLARLRAQETQGGHGWALVAALILPSLLLFGTVFALVYAPVQAGQWRDPSFARAVGLSLSLLLAGVACGTLFRKTWHWSHREPSKPSPWPWGAIAIVSVILITLIVLRNVRTSSSRDPALRLNAPATATVGSNTATTLCVYRKHDVDYILYYPGEFSTGVRSGSNRATGQWEDQGTITLANDRTIGFLRRALYPDHLHLNGREFDLRKGRVFTIGHTATVKQLSLAPQLVRTSEQLDAFAAAVRQHLSTRKPYPEVNLHNTTPFDGMPRLRLLRWQSHDEMMPHPSWTSEGTPLNDPSDLALIDALEFRNFEGPPGPHNPVLQLAFSHPAIDARSRTEIQLIDSQQDRIPTHMASICLDPSPELGGEGWALRSLALPDDTLLPQTILVRLRLSAGPWKVEQERLRANFDGAMNLGNGAILQGIARNARDETTLAIAVRVDPDDPGTQFEFTAVTHDGARVSRSSWSRSGQHGMESLTFKFPIPLSDVRSFDMHTRPVREFIYPDVILNPLPPAEVNGQRFDALEP